MNNPLSARNKRQLQEFLQKGYQALTQQKLDLAGDYCQRILKIKPDLAPGHFLVGLVALAMKQPSIAFSAFQSVVKLDKDHVPAWAHLANIYMKEGKVNLADDALKEALRIKTDDPIVLDLIGTVLTLMGENGLALEMFTRANAISSKHIPYMHNLANCLVHHGKTSQAESVFREILDIRPNFPQAHWALSTSQKAKDNSHIEEMTKLCDQNNEKSLAQAFYYYAIGKEYEDQQQWDKAFKAFTKGAAAKRSADKFDEQAEIDTFEYLTENLTEQWLKDGNTGYSDASPIFVLGQPRTGTTLIERIITSHTDVHSAGELQQFKLGLRRLGKSTSQKQFAAEFFDSAKNLDNQMVGKMYIQTTGKMRGNTPRFVDKLPQNYLMLPFIIKALPNAKIVHLVRNPMDSCFSSFKQLFADAYHHSYEQTEMARHHVRYRKLMQIWRERFGDRFFDISYEDTARNIEPNARALLSYLELPWQDECLNFHQQDSAVTTASSVQVREPAHTRSIGRWLKYEKQLQPMLVTLQEQGIDIY